MRKKPWLVAALCAIAVVVMVHVLFPGYGWSPKPQKSADCCANWASRHQNFDDTRPLADQLPAAGFVLKSRYQPLPHESAEPPYYETWAPPDGLPEVTIGPDFKSRPGEYGIIRLQLGAKPLYSLLWCEPSDASKAFDLKAFLAKCDWFAYGTAHSCIEPAESGALPNIFTENDDGVTAFMQK